MHCRWTLLNIPPALDPRAQCPPLCIPNITRLSYTSPPLWITFRSILPDRRQYRHRSPSRGLTRMLYACSYAKRTGDTTFQKHICVRGSLINFIVSEIYDAPQMDALFYTPSRTRSTGIPTSILHPAQWKHIFFHLSAVS